MSHCIFMSTLGQRVYCFFFQAEDGIRDLTVTGVQTCALPIFLRRAAAHKDFRRQRMPEPVGMRSPYATLLKTASIVRVTSRIALRVVPLPLQKKCFGSPIVPRGGGSASRAACSSGRTGRYSDDAKGIYWNVLDVADNAMEHSQTMAKAVSAFDK